MHRPRPGRRLTRCSIAVVAVAAAVLAPGLARADTGPGLPTPPADPLGGLTGAVGGVLGGGSGGSGGSGAGSGAGTGSTAAGAAAPAPAAGGPSSPAPLDPAQLQQLLQQLGQNLQISPDCGNGVLRDVTVVVGDLPEPLGSQLSGLVARLQQGPGSAGQPVALPVPQQGGTTAFTLPAPDPGSASGTGALAIAPPGPQSSALPQDLQKLLKDFTYDCLPQPASLPTAGGGSQPPSSAPVAAAPHAAQPASQGSPVDYPGYAPTGAGPGGPAGSEGSALPGEALLVLGSAGIAASWGRRRAHARR